MTTIAHNKPQSIRVSLHFDAATIEPAFVALTLIGIIVGAVLNQSNAAPTLLLAVYATTYVLGGFFAVREIIHALRQRTIEVDLLMVLAALGAAYVGAWTEGAILLFLFSLSNVLQHYAMSRTRRAISSLMALRPDVVAVRRDDSVVEQALDDVQVGEVVVLRPGDYVALDGTILHGAGNFDESSITGEALPVQKQVGDLVFAGTLNQSGALDIVVTKHASESTLSRIIAMVSAAQERKASTQSFLDRAEQYYAAGVIAVVALFIALVPGLFGVSFGDNFYRAMVLLTVASPCALVISVPAALLSAIANAARRGVLFKGGAYLETLSKVKVVAFDKTGTLTMGRPELADILPYAGVGADELLAAVVRAEQPSEHPIARAITNYAAAHKLPVAEPETFEAITGMGVRAAWDGETTLVGSRRLMEQHGHTVPADLQTQLDHLDAEGRRTALLVRRGERWLGIVAVMDHERPEAVAKIAALRKVGIERVVMLTGDSERIAHATAQRLGIDEVYAELLPEDKLRMIETLQQRYGGVAMIGDGVNDTPALASAEIGIAMGAVGTDAAMESADVVLMSDDLGAIAEAIRLSKRTQRIVWQNISFALAVVVVLVTLTLTIGIPLPLGVVGHEGSTILVVLNGLRLLVGERS